MRNLNDDSSCSSWPFFNIDKNLTNGQCYNGFTPRIISDGYPGYDKNALRQKILEHESIFKNQVNELHRLYGIQRNMMQEIKRKELHKHWASSVEPSSSSTRQGSQIPADNAQKWHSTMGFPLLNTSRVDIINSPSSCTKVYNTQVGRSPLQKGCTSKEYERVDFRPSKVRKKLFDLQLPADEYIDTEDGLGWLADLNEPVVVDKGTTPSYTKCINPSAKPNAGFPFLNGTLSRENEAAPTNGDLGLMTRSYLLNETHHPPRKYLTGHSREDIWRNGLDHGLEFSGGPFVHSSGFATSLSQPVSSWTKPTTSICQEITIPSRTMQSSCPSQEAYGDKWNVNSRLYPGSTNLGSKQPVSSPSSGFGFLKCGRGDNVISEPPTTKSLPDEAVRRKDLNVVDKSSAPSDKPSMFHWLGHKQVDKTEDAKPRKQESNDCGIRTKGETSVSQNSWKILGIPIFEILNAPEGKPSPIVSTSAALDCPSEGKDMKSEKKNMLIDINLACEPEENIPVEELIVENKTPTKCTSVDSRIDLNTCISEEDVKIVLAIDLEAPAPPEVEDDVITPSQPDENKAERVEDDVIENAAKTIFAMSSSCQINRTEDKICHLSKDSLSESILWFANVVSSFAKEKDDNAPIQDLRQDRLKEIDDFETTALQLAETKEKDYMPKPFITEVEQTGPTSLPSRSRRGQTRRGRQRKDFQRDVLPSLASLSRHEVTEDIQIFGGLMKATGQPWMSGLARRNGTRNGGGRGRRLKVVETIETPVCTPFDDRSLTGWGKTTRRPRRQRCPAGSPPVVSLS